MLSREEVLEVIGEDVETVFYDEFDDFIVGAVTRFGMSQMVVAYDYDKCLEKLVGDGMTYEEALEYFNYNTLGAWVGEGTPMFIKTKLD